MKIALVALACALLGGCSSFKLGAVCYLPHGMGGTCQIIPVPTAPAGSAV